MDESTLAVDKLVDSARQGDEGAWNQLVERYMPLVRSVIYRYRLTGADAADVNQTVWLRLVEHLDRLRDPRAMPGWIVTTTKNEALRQQASRRRVLPLDPVDLPQQRSFAVDTVHRAPEDHFETIERHAALRAALDELPPQRRELLMLLLLDPPVSYEEISRRTGMPIGSIGPTRQRCLVQLRRTAAFTRLLGDDRDEARR